MPELSTENTNAFAHRIAGDTLVYDCPQCDYGEVPITGLIESDTSRCLDCSTEYRLFVERAGEDDDS